MTESDLHRKESFEKVDSRSVFDFFYQPKNGDKTKTTQHDDDDV